MLVCSFLSSHKHSAFLSPLTSSLELPALCPPPPRLLLFHSLVQEAISWSFLQSLRRSWAIRLNEDIVLVLKKLKSGWGDRLNRSFQQGEPHVKITVSHTWGLEGREDESAIVFQLGEVRVESQAGDHASQFLPHQIKAHVFANYSETRTAQEAEY